MLHRAQHPPCVPVYFRRNSFSFLVVPLILVLFVLRSTSLHSKRFRGVGEQRKTKERNRNGILPARSGGESQNKEQGVGEGKNPGVFLQAFPSPPPLPFPSFFRGNSLPLNLTETLATQATVAHKAVFLLL